MCKGLVHHASRARRGVAAAANKKTTDLHNQRWIVTKILAGLVLGFLFASPAEADNRHQSGQPVLSFDTRDSSTLSRGRTTSVRQKE